MSSRATERSEGGSPPGGARPARPRPPETAQRSLRRYQPAHPSTHRLRFSSENPPWVLCTGRRRALHRLRTREPRSCSMSRLDEAVYRAPLWALQARYRTRASTCRPPASWRPGGRARSGTARRLPHGGDPEVVTSGDHCGRWAPAVRGCRTNARSGRGPDPELEEESARCSMHYSSLSPGAAGSKALRRTDGSSRPRCALTAYAAGVTCQGSVSHPAALCSDHRIYDERMNVGRRRRLAGCPRGHAVQQHGREGGGGLAYGLT